MLPTHSQVLPLLAVTALEWDRASGLLQRNLFSACDVAPKSLWQVLCNKRHLSGLQQHPHHPSSDRVPKEGFLASAVQLMDSQES